MKTTQYVRQERAIATADSSGIRERWTWGLRILHDPDAMTDSGRSLRRGVADKLIADAARAGQTLTDREIQRRLQCARAYPKESQIRRSATDFKSWTELHEAGFPPFDAPADEPDADWRTETERKRDRARTLAATDLDNQQLDLFPLDTFEPSEATLKELADYAREQAEITERFARRDRDRRDYLDALIDAVDGDLSKTWQDARDRLAETAS